MLLTFKLRSLPDAGHDQDDASSAGGAPPALGRGQCLFDWQIRMLNALLILICGCLGGCLQAPFAADLSMLSTQDGGKDWTP